MKKTIALPLVSCLLFFFTNIQVFLQVVSGCASSEKTNKTPIGLSENLTRI
jgi:hypothetical protein